MCCPALYLNAKQSSVNTHHVVEYKNQELDKSLWEDYVQQQNWPNKVERRINFLLLWKRENKRERNKRTIYWHMVYCLPDNKKIYETMVLIIKSALLKLCSLEQSLIMLDNVLPCFSHTDSSLLIAHWHTVHCSLLLVLMLLLLNPNDAGCKGHILDETWDVNDDVPCGNMHFQVRK